MDLILLSGNSVYTKEWIESVKEELKELFYSTYIYYYNHWETGEKNIDLDFELRKLSEYLNSKKNYIIFAKSAGAVLVLRAVSEGKISPKKCMFTGIPLSWCNELCIPFTKWIKNYKIPTYFVQKTKDPYLNFDELKKILEENDVKNFKLIKISGEDHQYNNLKELKELMEELMDNQTI